jgi:phospholipid/cholesterol/gamma-HCH transport system substrate-binding protein
MRPGQHKRLPNHVVGLILIVIVAVGSFLAYTKKLPWSHGYEIKAVFTTAENIRVKSPVRIAGVNVGTVTDVQHLSADSPEYQAATGKARAPRKMAPGQQAAVVTMQINDSGRPINEDATFKLRPRLFLEGNMFVDLQPGSPNAPEAPNDYTFPLTQTSSAVQLDQVLTTLQGNVRQNLQTFLKEFGNALVKYNGANGFRTYFATSPGANRYTAEVNQALLGTEPNDLSGLVKNLDSTVQALDADETGLQNLVTNLRVVTGSFAAQNRALASAIGELPHVLEVGRPALAHLSDSFPPLRAFAREALPGVRSTPETLDAATPLLHQIRGLVSKPELRGLTHDLRPTIPRLTKLTKRTIPFLHQSRALASCFNQVVIPWSNSSVPDPEPAPPTVTDGAGTHPATVYEETGYGLTGIGGESRSGDANGEYIRVEAGGGANTPVIPGPINGGVGQVITGLQPASQTVPFVGFAESQILGSRPNLSAGHEDSLKTPFRPTKPCERQQPPNLEASTGPAPPQTPAGSGSLSSSSLPAPLQNLGHTALDYTKNYFQAQQLSAQGKNSQAQALLKQAGAEWLRYQSSSQPWLKSEVKKIDSLGGSALRGTPLGGSQ